MSRRVIVNCFAGMVALSCLLVGTRTIRADVLNMGAGLVSLEMMPIGQPGNAADANGYGAVSYEYSISKFEVTNAQYAEFLNAVAATDTYGLWSSAMDITRSGTAGAFSYSVKAGGADPNAWQNRPIRSIRWASVVRFVNWLENGQPTGPQGIGTTESGAYHINGTAASDVPTLMTIVREPDAKWVLPNENEWYKAAYYDPQQDSYYTYATASDVAPGNTLPDVTGNNSNHFAGGFADATFLVTEVGAFENSSSAYGVSDMDGNVNEWTETVFDADSFLARGGGYNHPATDSDTRYNVPMWGEGNLGFRVGYVGVVPEPVSVILFGAGVMLLLLRRNHATS